VTGLGSVVEGIGFRLWGFGVIWGDCFGVEGKGYTVLECFGLTRFGCRVKGKGYILSWSDVE
jgi:hypothetical protein